MRKPVVALVFGTRPEAIKLAPVAFALRECTDRIDWRIIVTGQHRAMLDQALAMFDLKPDVDLDIMIPGQTLYDITVRCLAQMNKLLSASPLDMVIVQGDTTTTFAAALAAFYKQIPVAHVEAGLRTHNKLSPFPEEVNRRLTGVIADLHFPPTETSRDNLFAEKVDPSTVEVTGNTSIDALQWVLANRQPQFGAPLDRLIESGRRIVLLTSHRRENFGDPMRRAFQAIARTIQAYPDLELVFPVHPNPNVRREVEAVFAGQSRVHLIDPLDYVNFAHLMRRSYLILTDSGGVQEEAPTLGKPVLVLRDTTERPEGVHAGTARLVGTDAKQIESAMHALLSDAGSYARMAEAVNPYGDGLASRRIVERIVKFLASRELKS